MKNSIKTQLSFFFLLFTFALSAQDSETRSLDRFNELRVSEGIELIAKKGNENSITLEVSRIDVEDVITEVRGGRLYVRIARRVRTSRSRRIEAVLTYKDDLESIGASTSAEISVEDMIDVQYLDLKASTSGTVDVKVRAKEVEMSSSTSGRINVVGDADDIEATASTGGMIYAYNLEAKEAYSRASTGGDVRINVSDRLRASASTGGNISYKGQPRTDRRTNTGGSVRRGR